MKNKILLIPLAVLLAISLVAVGCPAEEEPPPPPPPTDEEEPPPTGPVSGGILRIATLPDAEALGYPPNMPRLYDFKFALPTLEALVNFDENLAPIPGLAKEWEVDVAAKTITLVLQEGVKFHDDTDFNANVAKWNLDGIRNSARTELDLVTSIDVIDDYTIRLNLSEFDNSILISLGMTPGLMISQAAFEKNGAEWCEKNPVGTGPFKFVSWERDVKQVYTRFDGYWQEGKPYLDGVELIIIVDPMVRLASLMAGEVDIATDIEPKDARRMETEGEYRIESSAAGFYGLTPDSANPDSVLANIKVRQAIEYAIDKETLCETLGYGYWGPLYQAAVPGSWAENPNVVGYHYNPAKAKQLLEEAGYPDGVEITIYSMNSPQTIVDMVTAVQGYLKAVGIDAKLELMEHGRFGVIFAGAGWTDGIAMMPMGFSPDEIGLLNRLYLPGSILFPSTARPPEYQQKLLEISKAPDLTTKQKLIWEAQKIMIDDNAMVCWIHTSPEGFTMNPKVHNDGFGKTTSMHWTPADCWMEQ